MNERDWLKQRVDAVLTDLAKRADGRLWYCKIAGGRFQRVGLPDYVLCVRGRFAALELKHPSDETADLSAAQRYVLRKLREAGAAILVARDPAAVECWVGNLLAVR